MKTMIAITFIAGLLPVIGNLISNTVIVIVSLSHSLPTAAVALLFLIVIHKLEYFLNARIGLVDLVDHQDIGHSGVELARVVAGLGVWSERIDDGDEQVGLVEREVVVAAVPQHHVGFLLGLAEDRLVVHARVHGDPHAHRVLVLLALRLGVLLEVVVKGPQRGGRAGLPARCACVDQRLCRLGV